MLSIFGLFPYPRRLRVARAALVAAQASGLRRVLKKPSVAAHLPPVVRAMESVAPPPTPYQRLGRRIPAVGPRAARWPSSPDAFRASFFRA